MHLRYCSETPTFYQNYLAMCNTTDVTGGKPIAVWSQSVLGVIAINPLVVFYDIHGRKREVLLSFGPGHHTGLINCGHPSDNRPLWTLLHFAITHRVHWPQGQRAPPLSCYLFKLYRINSVISFWINAYKFYQPSAQYSHNVIIVSLIFNVHCLSTSLSPIL
jgi:hypothetical protein